MKLRLGTWTLTITLENNAIDFRIKKLLAEDKFIAAIKELRNHRMQYGGDSSLKTCKHVVEQMRIEYERSLL